MVDLAPQSVGVYLTPLPFSFLSHAGIWAPTNQPSIGQADVASYKGDGFGVDIGPLTVGDFHSEIEKAKTFFWNGPMGIIEMPRYALGACRGVAAC
jgi:3-phosphoglycerate kinase